MSGKFTEMLVSGPLKTWMAPGHVALNRFPMEVLASHFTPTDWFRVFHKHEPAPRMETFFNPDFFNADLAPAVAIRTRSITIESTPA